MTQRPLRGTVVGCGFFAENHLNAWASIPDMALVAVCDLDPTKAASAAKRFGAGRHYTDAATMLREEKPDFVDIATTVASHGALVESAAAEKIRPSCKSRSGRPWPTARRWSRPAPPPTCP